MKYTLHLLFVLCLTINTYGQDNVGIGTTSPDNSAVLDVSSTDKGMLTPRMSTNARGSIVDPAEGLIVYDTDTDSFWYFTGTKWLEVGSAQSSFGGEAFQIDSALTGLIPNPNQNPFNYHFGTLNGKILVDGDKFIANSRLRTYLFQLSNNTWTLIDSLTNTAELIQYYKNDTLITTRTAGSNSVRQLNLYTTDNGSIDFQFNLLLPEYIRSVFIESNFCYIGYYDTYAGNDPPQIGGVAVYDMSTSPWTLTQTIVPPVTPYINDNFGESILVEDNILYVGSTQGGVMSGGAVLGSGAVYMYQEVAGNWQLMTTIPAPDVNSSKRFGYEILSDGEHFLIGCNNSGVGTNEPIHVYEKVGDSLEWLYDIESPLPGGHFGSDFIINGDYLLVGNTFQNNSKMSCFLFQKNGQWDLQHQLDIEVSFTGNGTNIQGGIGLSDNYLFYGVSNFTDVIPYGIYYLQNQSQAGPKWDEITCIPDGFSDGIDNVNDADADPNNEHNLSLTQNGSNIELTDGGGTLSLNLLDFPNQWTPGLNDAIYYINGNVGIGEKTPATNLDVAGNSQITFNSSSNNPHINLVESKDAGDGARINFKGDIETNNLWTLYGRANNTSSNSRFNIYYNGIGNILTLNGLGYAGIKGNPDADLHVFHGTDGRANGFKMQNGSSSSAGEWMRFFVSSSGELQLYSKAKGTSSIGSFDPGTGAYTSISDRRQKNNFQNLYFNWSSFMALNTLTYKFKDDPKNKRHLGLIAQEVLDIYPELVTYHKEEDLYHLNYSGTGVIAIKAAQELRKENQALKAELEELQKKLDEQDKRLAKIEAAMLK